jgi:hypothetical protein
MVGSWPDRKGGGGIAIFCGLCLHVLVIVGGMTMFPAFARAEEVDDFGLTEVDPELPQKIVKWNADCLSCHSRQALPLRRARAWTWLFSRSC